MDESRALQRFSFKLEKDKINAENRGFHVEIRGPQKASAGVELVTVDAAMRLFQVHFEGDTFIIQSLLYCSIEGFSLFAEGINDPGCVIVKGQEDCKHVG